MSVQFFAAPGGSRGRVTLGPSIRRVSAGEAEFVDVLVGEPAGLGKSVPGGGSQDDGDRAVQVTQVPGGDVDRADLRAGPEHAADRLALVDERGAVAAVGAGLVVLADQPRLGAADRGEAPARGRGGRPGPSVAGGRTPVRRKGRRRAGSSTAGTPQARAGAHGRRGGPGRTGTRPLATTPTRSTTSNVWASVTTTAA